MSRRDNVLKVHRDAIKDAASRRKAKSIALVGSVARDEDTEDSDYDFLVEFAEGTGYFTMGALLVELEELLGDKVDVVPAKGVEDHCRGIFEDAIPL